MTPISLGSGRSFGRIKERFQFERGLRNLNPNVRERRRRARREQQLGLENIEGGGTPQELLQNVIRAAREGESVSSGHLSREGTNPLSGVTPSGDGSLFSQLGDSIDELRDTIEEGQEAQEEEQRRAEGSTLSQRTARLRGLLRGFRFGT